MALLQDFKKFISRGNVFDMAIGIILGASFTKVVDALVNHILMPPLSLVGGNHFSHLKIPLRQASDGMAPIILDLGLFINSVFDFLIVGFSVFIFIKLMNRFHMKVAFFTKKTCPECRMEVPIDARRCAHCTAIFDR